MQPQTSIALNDGQLAALRAQFGAQISELPPLPNETRADFSWSHLAAGRVRLIDQLNHNGQRLVLIAPCTETPERALTAVENRIARRAGQALTNKQIGLELKLSQTAVENHLSRALRKLGLRDRIALARLYTQLEAAGRT